MADQNFKQSPTGQSVLGILNAAGETRPLSPADPMPVGVVAAAPNIACSQADIALAAATLLPARATRREVTILNLDAANPFYYKELGTTVTSTNGFKIAAGASKTIKTTAGIQSIATGGTVRVCIEEVYD